MVSILVLVVALFTLTNILVSAYMSYNTIQLAIEKCNCAVYNAYWFIIVIYFLASGLFLLYALMVLFGVAKGVAFVYLMVGYVLATMVYVAGSFMYTRYLQSNACNCVGEQYKHFLQVITLFRMLMAIIMGISLLTWGVYAYLRKSFVPK